MQNNKNKRVSYLKSKIKEEKKQSFFGKQLNDSNTEEILGHQFERPIPFNIQTQSSNHFASNSHNIYTNSNIPPNIEQISDKRNSKKKITKKKKEKSILYRLKNLFYVLIDWIRNPQVSSSITLFLILPILFILSVFGKDFTIKYIFICAAIAGSIWIILKKLFSDGIRFTIVASYISLSVIIIINLVTGINITQFNNSITSTTPGKTISLNNIDNEVVSDETPEPINEEVNISLNNTNSSETKINFDKFMSNWQNGDIEQMLEFVSPTWKNQHKDPTNALFNLLLNRRPKEYEIEDISGSDNDFARTITMNTMINKFTSDEYVKIRYQILMIKENNIWYIDPSTLGTNYQPTPTVDPKVTPSPTVAPRTTVTPKPGEDTTLYYNSNGGKMYHIDPECSAVNKKYLPLTPFTFGELKTSPYSSLTPCQVCRPPH